MYEKRILLSGILILLAAAASAAGRREQVPYIVDPDWLSKNQAAVLIFDVGRSYEEYAAAHIPGAVYIDRTLVWEEVEGISGMLPPLELLIPELENRGVSSGARLVFYDGGNSLWAARFFWALEVLGHKDVHVLDGGFGLWNSLGLPVSMEEPDIVQGKINLDLQLQYIATAEEIQSGLGEARNIIIDTRGPAEYSGEDVRSARGGHIPGALNINWIENNAVGEVTVFKEAEELSTLYAGVADSTKERVITHCQTGVRGASTYLVLRNLGYENVAIYDGSWAEWGNQAGLPIAGGTE